MLEGQADMCPIRVAPSPSPYSERGKEPGSSAMSPVALKTFGHVRERERERERVASTLVRMMATDKDRVVHLV